MNDVTREHECLKEDVAAYLDGELSRPSLDHFEAHLANCTDCAAELRAQRQLLCTLEAAFTQSPHFDLPQDFTRVVAVRAESDLRGVRGKTERRRALQMCALLALGAFALLGVTIGTIVLQPVRSFFQILARVSGLLWQTTYEAAVGVGVILRMVGRAAIAGPNGFAVLLVLAFLIAASLLPRLIANYHRAQTID